jgi:ribosomal protein S18 acetylase RimI-like enzyme
MAAVHLREATLVDASAIVRLIGEHAALSGEQTPITEAYVATYLASPTGKILLAEVQNRVVGLLSYSIRPDLFHAGPSCFLEELIVEEVARGEGVGSALVSDLLSRLTSLACAEVSVAVMPNNHRAIKFYRTHGLIEEALYLEKHFTA